MARTTIAILATLMLMLASAGAADSLAGQASVIDGDPLEIHGTRIRLWGIDAPESSQLCRNDESELHQCGRTASDCACRATLRHSPASYLLSDGARSVWPHG